jgi:hypothetical protein
LQTKGNKETKPFSSAENTSKDLTLWREENEMRGNNQDTGEMKPRQY